MQDASTIQKSPRWAVLATFILSVLALHLAKDVLIPLALAVLLAFLLSPLASRLARLGLGSTASVILTTTLAFAALTAVGWLVGTQALGLMEEIPKYEQNIEARIMKLKSPQVPFALSQTANMVQNLEHDLKEPGVAEEPAPDGRQPQPVLIVPAKGSMIGVALSVIEPILGPLGTAGIVIVFVFAILLQRKDLRSRLIKLTGEGSLNATTEAMDDAARRVSRYLAMQFLVNASYGIPIGIGLYFIGIPNAMLWGLLSTLLRFIPYLGPWMAAAFPVVLALAIDPGWGKVAWTLGLFFTAELVTANLIEVWIYGKSTGVSGLALLVAAVFWTWLWGIPGLFLSTPITVCLMVLGKYVPGLNFFTVMLSSEPALEPPAHFYQRMLALDSDELLGIASKFIEEHSLTEFYDEVFAPALILSEEQRHSGALSEARQRFVFQGGRDLIDELRRRTEEAGSGPPPAPEVLAIPARDEADELVALMLQHLLLEAGISAEVLPVAAGPEGAAQRLEHGDITVAFVSALPPSALAPAGRAVRRLRERWPRMRLVVGVWSHQADVAELTKRLGRQQPDALITTLREAIPQAAGSPAPLARSAPTLP